MVRLLKYVSSEYELTEYELIIIRVRLNQVRFNTFCPFGKNNLVRLIRLYVLSRVRLNRVLLYEF